MPSDLYQKTLDYIYGFVNFETLPTARDATHFDLRRMYELLAALGNPQQVAKSVHIAGTKGKGSTSAMISSVLSTAGYRTGLYTSPHLSDLRERIQIDGRMISRTALIRLARELKPVFGQLDARAAYGKLTTFEVLTALAFAYFARRQADFQVLEVGLGGRLDATNVIIPEVSVITAISLDHTEVLGNTLEAIAGEKAGIIKPGVPVAVSPQSPEVTAVFETVARKNQSRIVKVGTDVTWRSLGCYLGGQRFQVKGLLGEYKLEIPLLGQHQLENAANAVAALELLKQKGYRISPENIADGLKRVRWPGRFEILSRQPLVVADGAHNRESARRLRESLEQYFCRQSEKPGGNGLYRYKKSVLVMGASLDKDVDGIISELGGHFDRVIVTGSRHPRAMSPEKLKAKFAGHGIKVEIAADVPEALKLATVEKNNLVCVTGSLFVVGEARDAQ
ncbi:MAG: bifunctional folylpolyglutamate synthase/dihydrofolate synthase [Dehalococcoidia bacterium]|nr:MAG: bifunctional folylpolyglutamate synthase/dihydrofolate synthase [Dehalococcoidia bacterium]